MKVLQAVDRKLRSGEMTVRHQQLVDVSRHPDLGIDEHHQVMKKCTLCVDRIYDEKLPEAERKPACVMACPTSARLFGDIHDPASTVSQAIRDNGGYALMPEWGTQPANHYLPRRKTEMRLHKDELERVDNPLKIDGQLPKPALDDPALDDVTSW